MEIENLNENIELCIFKCRNVKTPTKSWEAAGWDLFVPENLSIFDFTKSYKAFLDESVIFNKGKVYEIPLEFYVRSDDNVSEEKRCFLSLVLNYTTSQWDFKVNSIDINDETNNFIKWLKKPETVITKIIVHPHSKINIPSGIHVNLPDNVFLKIENKSGISSKRGLSYLADIIDVDYMGEIHLNLVNTSNLSVNICAGEKIVQAIPMFQPKMNKCNEFKSLEDLYKDKNSKRGAGGFGSSGEK